MVNTYLTTQKRAKTLTEKQQKFLDSLIVTNGDPKQAAELAGYSGNHYQVIRGLKEEIIDLATNVLANSAPEAAFKLVEIMKTNKPIPQIVNKLQAATAILDRVGVTKKERLDVNHNYSGGVFILPEKRQGQIIDLEVSKEHDE
jgi:phage terminase small subunit|tara:strand:+ start:308 stop:739 length:432 start_codon:yes stop_codon:yes gene_type:complete